MPPPRSHTIPPHTTPYHHIPHTTYHIPHTIPPGLFSRCGETVRFWLGVMLWAALLLGAALLTTQQLVAGDGGGAATTALTHAPRLAAACVRRGVCRLSSIWGVWDGGSGGRRDGYVPY